MMFQLEQKGREVEDMKLDQSKAMWVVFFGRGVFSFF